MSISLSPGSRLPAYCTSMGRVLLAGLPEAEAREVLRRHRPEPRTPRTVTDPDAIMAIISRVRSDGYAINDQEIELGLRSIAVPLFDARGRTIAASTSESQRRSTTRRSAFAMPISASSSPYSRTCGPLLS